MTVHLKLSDLEVRNSIVGLELVRSSQTSSVLTALVAANSSLKNASAYDLILYERADIDFTRAPSNTRLIVISNISDTSELAEHLLHAAYDSRGNIGIAARLAKFNDITYTQVAASNVLTAHDLKVAYVSYLMLLNPFRLLIGGGGYFAVAQTYAGVASLHPSYWSYENAIGLCDGRIVERAALSFNYGNCSKFSLLNSEELRHMRLIGGWRFEDNHWISYLAFFWASLALNLSFYFVWMSVVFARASRRALASVLFRGVINTEGVLFTPIFSCLSVIFLIIFALKVIMAAVFSIII
jgi:hypothetical protein